MDLERGSWRRLGGRLVGGNGEWWCGDCWRTGWGRLLGGYQKRAGPNVSCIKQWVVAFRMLKSMASSDWDSHVLSARRT